MVGAAQLPAHCSLPHLLERDDVAHDRCDVDALGGKQIRRSAAISAERTRDGIEPINFGENSTDILVEHAIEIRPVVAARSSQMLDAEAYRRKRILDFEIGRASCRGRV